MHIFRMMLILSAISGLVCCGAVEELQDALVKQRAIKADILAQTNLKSQVGWDVEGGTLTQVTISFDASEVTNYTVADLIIIVKPLIAKHFEEKPQAIIVSVIISPNAALSHFPQ